VPPTGPRPAQDAASGSWPGLRTRLAAIDGLDLARGLDLFGGELDLYLRVLRRFVAVYAKGLPELAPAPGARSLEGLVAAAHSLRGASGAIGATRIEQKALRIEARGETAMTGVDLEQALARLQALLVDTAAGIEAVLDDEARLAEPHEA
jgi:HPt (histidine-containing phosphotransfer) domain-containing protein